MNAIFSALANGLILSTFLAAAVWLALRLSKRSFNAATRYVIWWVALVATIALPIVFLPTHQRTAALAATAQRNAEIFATDSVAPSSNFTSSVPLSAPTKHSWLPSIPIHIPDSPWTERFGELWALVSLLLLARLAAGFVALHRQKKYAREASPELRELMRELMDRCLTARGIKRQVCVALIPKGNSPMLAGVIRPCVLIPERLLPELDSAEMKQIFLHEATHAARYDDWALLLQRVIQAVFVFYPVVHWVMRQINLEREAACDATVIAVTGDARAYAKCLTHVAELSVGYWKSPLAAAIADEKSHLTRRIHMLFDKNRHTATRLLTFRLALAAATVSLLAALAATSPAFFASAQSPDASANWEKAAGGKMSFEVASVKINKLGPNGARYSNVISLNPGAPFTRTGGLFTTTNEPLPVIVAWAFDLSGDEQLRVFAEMPRWAMAERLDIEAKTEQALLEDRFKLVVHTETKYGRVYALEMVTPGKLGPQLRPHMEDSSCATEKTGLCAGGLIRMPPSAPGLIRYEGRNVTTSVIAKYLPLTANFGTDLDHPIIDRTGLTGAFDFSIEFKPQMGAAAQMDSGSTLIEALKDQLGLKLEPATGPVKTLVIDHIEEPTPN